MSELRNKIENILRNSGTHYSKSLDDILKAVYEDLTKNYTYAEPRGHDDWIDICHIEDWAHEHNIKTEDWR